MANELTEQIRRAVWEYPDTAMNSTQYGGEWKRKDSAREWHGGRVRITRAPSGNLYLHGNHGSGMAGTSTPLIDFLMNEWNTDTTETVRRLCEMYGIALEWTEEQRTQYRQRKVAQVVAPVLVNAAQDGANQTTQGVQYLNGRGCDTHTGAFGLLTAQSIAEARNAVLTANIDGVTPATVDADLSALGVTAQRMATHPVVIPNTTDGIVNGFAFRKVTQGGDSPKYLFSKGLQRGAYSGTLSDGVQAVIVEGQLDALRLRTLGVPNVIAIGGAKPSDTLRDLLRRHHITDVVYIPDVEYKDGKRRTDLEDRAVECLRTMDDTESGYSVAGVRVARIPVEQGADLNTYKRDADDYGRTHTAQDVRNLIDAAPFWFIDSLQRLEAELNATTGVIDTSRTLNRIREIYAGISDPLQRGMFRKYVESGTDTIYKTLGVDTHTLEQLDEINRNRAFREDMKDGAEALAKAAQTGDADRMAAAVSNLNETLNRGRGTREEWDAQLSQGWDAVAEMIATQPEPIKTKWRLGRDEVDAYGKRFKPYGQIELWADDITVFCAPTSHGKTMILFQILLDLVRADLNTGKNKKYLFVSREEQPRQLALRALNVWISRKVLKTGTRRAALRDTLRGNRPVDYTDKEFEKLQSEIEEYKNNVFPRLALVHTDGSAESIAANVVHYTEAFRRDGVELGAVFVDYFQLLESDTPNRMRNYELKTVCTVLKQAAGRSGIPFVVAAQLNRDATKNGIDDVELSNIGEGADIERIAHDVYMMWQIRERDKGINIDTDKNGKESYKKDVGQRARRLFSKDQIGEYTPYVGHIYVERLKAREGVTGLWGLLPYDGESGQIDETRDAPAPVGTAPATDGNSNNNFIDDNLPY